MNGKVVRLPKALQTTVEQDFQRQKLFINISGLILENCSTVSRWLQHLVAADECGYCHPSPHSHFHKGIMHRTLQSKYYLGKTLKSFL